MDSAQPAQIFAHRRDEHAVVGERIQRAVVPELLVEGGQQDERIGREHAAGMIRHQQHAASGREGVQAADLGAEPSSEHRCDHTDDPLGEDGVPLGELWLVDFVVAHVRPCEAVRYVKYP